ncbi:MAG TPA: hypothetical protein VEP90_01700 [Methylomirabilota bacterium]|nr:hypothetical protein [Methylomirabilota bacterium]
MNKQDMLEGIPKLSTILPKNKIYLWDNFFFLHLNQPLYQKATELAEKISKISRGRKTLLLSDNSEIVGKVGEFVVREFCRQNIKCEWVSMAETVNEHGGDNCDLTILNIMVDVKTRQLHTDITIAPTIELRVPQTEFDRYQDIFILAGYCPTTMYGYVLGWCTWEELESSPVRTDIRFPAHCVPLTDLHPMKYLELYAERRSKEKKSR